MRYESPFLNELHAVAQQGDIQAQIDLGMMYADGRGVPKDYDQAHKWFSLAAAQASGTMKEELTELRNLVAYMMTLRKSPKPNGLAEEWPPKRQ